MSDAEMTEAQFLSLVHQTVEAHGCKVVEINFENGIINIEGPEADKTECAIALQNVLG